MKIGIQLYSVRDVLEKDLSGGLKKLAALGYKSVETAGHYGLTATELKAEFDQHGLSAVSSHTGLSEILDQFDQVVADANILGVKTVVVPWIDPKSYANGWYDIVDQLNEAGEKLQAVGLRLGYHNHAFEFESFDGGVPIEYIADHTDPKTTGLELDLAWVQVGGGDPVTWIERVAGSSSLLHYKDIDKDKNLATIGQGILDWDAIIAASLKADIQYAHVEHDSPTDALQFAADAMEFLKSKGLSA